MKNILLCCLLISLAGCAAFEKQVVAPPNPDFTYMNKDNAPGLVVVVPPSEIRTLREMVLENNARLNKVEITANNAAATANNAAATANLALENQTIYNSTIQLLSNKIEDYKKACLAMFEKMLKK